VTAARRQQPAEPQTTSHLARTRARILCENLRAQLRPPDGGIYQVPRERLNNMHALPVAVASSDVQAGLRHTVGMAASSITSTFEARPARATKSLRTVVAQRVFFLGPAVERRLESVDI